jgi:gamma-glutamyltranspeptidase/glutathione hydrolase
MSVHHRRKLFFSVIVSLYWFLQLQAQDRVSGKSFATRSMVIAQHGMAATSHPLATITAIDILKKGGTAIDAAIGANAVLGVTDPEMNGIGGDLFAIVYDAKTKKLYGLNASGRSPYSLNPEEFKKRNLEFIPTSGPLSVSVPGCVDGWFELHKKFGKLPMTDILAGAIGYARNGFPVANEFAFEALNEQRRLDNIRSKDPNAQNAYYGNLMKLYFPGGKAFAEGEIFKNPDLANTIEKIAKGGRDVFYKGEIAKSIDAYMKKSGGFLSTKDFNDHTSLWIEPVSTTYRGYQVWELPPNGQGITVLQMLNILEPFDFSKINYGSPEHIHLLTEATKLAYEDRAKYYADPEFAKIPVQELISKSYGVARSKLINSENATAGFTNGNPVLNKGETVYLTVADEAGNMISLIQSICSGFGAEMVPDGLGFVLQNRGLMFTLQEGENNTYAPHKRPFHTIIPAFVTKDGLPYMSFGVMGGGFQPVGHVQVLMNIIDFGMNIQEAGDAPRIFPSGYSQPMGQKQGKEEIALESGFSSETISALKDMGHSNIVYGTPGLFGGYQSIKYDAVKKIYYGASDPRKDGMAAGY